MGAMPQLRRSGRDKHPVDRVNHAIRSQSRRPAQCSWLLCRRVRIATPARVESGFNLELKEEIIIKSWVVLGYLFPILDVSHDCSILLATRYIPTLEGISAWCYPARSTPGKRRWSGTKYVVDSGSARRPMVSGHTRPGPHIRLCAARTMPSPPQHTHTPN